MKNKTQLCLAAVALISLNACNDHELSYGAKQMMGKMNGTVIGQAPDTCHLDPACREAIEINQRQLDEYRRQRDLRDAEDRGREEGRRGSTHHIFKMMDSPEDDSFIRAVAKTYKIPVSSARKLVLALVGISSGHTDDLQSLGLNREAVARVWSHGELSRSELVSVSQSLQISTNQANALLRRLARKL